MLRLLAIAILSLTAMGFSAAVSECLAKYSDMTAAECEEMLDNCARYCDTTFDNVNRRRDCIDTCNDQYNHCFAESKTGPHDLSHAPSVTGKPPKKHRLEVPSAPIQRH
jgi:hypothetical protein